MSHAHGLHEAIPDDQPQLKTTCGKCRKRHFRRNTQGMKVVAIACDCGETLYPWGYKEANINKDLDEYEKRQQSFSETFLNT